MTFLCSMRIIIVCDTWVSLPCFAVPLSSAEFALSLFAGLVCCWAWAWGFFFFGFRFVSCDWSGANNEMIKVAVGIDEMQSLPFFVNLHQVIVG